jgi:hypothetical protein
MDKKELTTEEIYKKNQKKSKILRIISPILFWGFLGLSIICLIFAIKNSFGNVAEICDLLNDKAFTGEQLRENYAYLCEKYGEWTIGSGDNGFTVMFVNVGKAMFSGVMVVSRAFAIIFFVSAFILGKWLLPKISSQILIDNQDMVNLAVLKKEEK